MLTAKMNATFARATGVPTTRRAQRAAIRVRAEPEKAPESPEAVPEEAAPAQPRPLTAADEPEVTPEAINPVQKGVMPDAPTEPVVSGPPSLFDAMKFSGMAPELINGRLAMLAFVTAVAAELSSGKTIFQQLDLATGPVAGTMVLFAAASLVPILKGADDGTQSVGPLNRTAEIWNGRVAMMGLTMMTVLELNTNKPVF
ncbi:unnamed protein product [Pedinophyceae sp. YPF-701]|nr:unnamed protein product [Pedinophyceae sp. YPF-701]